MQSVEVTEKELSFVWEITALLKWGISQNLQTFGDTDLWCGNLVSFFFL